MNAAPLLAPLPLEELLTLAHQHEQAGHLEPAERALRRVLDTLPTQPDALHLLGIVLYKGGRMAEALVCMEAAIAHGVNTPLYYRNIGEIYRTLGRHAEAQAAARRGVLLNPHDPLALLNLGVVLADQLKVDEAIACFERALALQPDLAGAHFGLAEALLMRGSFERGWEEYEWRFRIADTPRLMPDTDRPQWDGGPLPGGTLLLIADQGFGDGIQFGRYIPWVARRCRDVVLACSPTLKPILEQLHPKVRVVAEWPRIGAFDAWCPLTGLPRLAGTRLDTIPAGIPYLHAEPERVARWAARLEELVPAGLRRVGLVWAGRPTHKNDRKRSMSLRDLAPVTALDGIVLVVLQKGPSQRQVGGHYGHSPLVHLSAEVSEFRDTMAIIDNLDLVLSVDTSVAHLAGAMGRPVWIMLPWAAEWRWMLGRTDTPWYPTARLFRQAAPGEWAGVAQDVSQALQGWR